MGTKTTRLAERPTFGVPRVTNVPSRRLSRRRSAALKRALNEHEPALAFLAHERAIALNVTTGQPLFTQEANRRINPRTGEVRFHASVDFTKEQLAQVRGNVVTHNHPGGLPFSPEDVAFASRFGVAEMRAVTTTARYSMRPPRGGWTLAFYRTKVQPALRAAREDVRREELLAVWKGLAGYTTPGGRRGDERHWDMVWERVAAATGMIYRKESWTP
jgi:hypothetical protein